MASQIIQGLSTPALVAPTEMLDRIKTVDGSGSNINTDQLDGLDAADFGDDANALKFGGAEFNHATISIGSGTEVGIGPINISGGFFQSFAIIFYGVSALLTSEDSVPSGTDTSQIEVDLDINGSPITGAEIFARVKSDNFGAFATAAYNALYTDMRMFVKTSGLGSAWTADLGTANGENELQSRWIFVIGA